MASSIRLCEDGLGDAVLESVSVCSINLRFNCTYGERVVEPQTLVEIRDGLDLAVREVEAADVKVLCEPGLVVRLGDDGDAPLGSPTEQDLGRGLAVLVCDALDGLVIEEKSSVLGVLHAELEEGLGTE